MEKDRTTRLYWYKEAPLKTAEAWPNKTNLLSDRWVTGEEATATRANADYICVSVRRAGSDYWIVHSQKQREEADDFTIDFSSEGAENYSNLAKKLEERSGREGLTVLIC